MQLSHVLQVKSMLQGSVRTIEIEDIWIYRIIDSGNRELQRVGWFFRYDGYCVAESRTNSIENLVERRHVSVARSFFFLLIFSEVIKPLCTTKHDTCVSFSRSHFMNRFADVQVRTSSTDRESLSYAPSVPQMKSIEFGSSYTQI